MGDAAGVLSYSDFDDILRSLERKLDEAWHEFQNLVRNVERGMDQLGILASLIWDEVRALLDRAWGLLKKCFDLVLECATAYGNPWVLSSHGNDWKGPAVGARISVLAQQAHLDELRADDFWGGTAFDAYRNTVARQEKALSALVRKTHTIDDVLTKMALAIGSFWVAVIAALVSFVIELCAEGAVATTGVGAPPAAAAAGVSASKVFAIVSAVFAAFYAFGISEVVPAMKDLGQELHSDFPAGWPQSTSLDIIADGSLSDDNPTRWRLKQ